MTPPPPPSPRRTALVTGGAGSIGRAIATRLRDAGHDLILLDRSAQVVEVAGDLARSGARVEGLVADISSEAEISAAFAEVDARFGRLDVLVNNAGVTLREEGRKPDAFAISRADWKTMMAVNLTGTFLMSRAAIPGMVARRWGRIINISSLGGRIGSRFNGMHYSASKAGMLGLTRTMALELARDGITVNAITPGRIATEANIRTGTDPRVIEALIPANRLGTPDEVAAATGFLASDDAAYMTGVTMDVNGGLFMA